MGYMIACIPADNEGNKLWLKEPRIDGKRIFVKYRSTHNDIPFMETELFMIDAGSNLGILADDGTILWRFSPIWIDRMMDN